MYSARKITFKDGEEWGYDLISDESGKRKLIASWNCKGFGGEIFVISRYDYHDSFPKKMQVHSSRKSVGADLYMQRRLFEMAGKELPFEDLRRNN